MPDVLIEGVTADTTDVRRASSATTGRSLTPTARRLLERVVARMGEDEGPAPDREALIPQTLGPPTRPEDG